MERVKWHHLAAGLLLMWLAIGWTAPAAAHPMPESLVWIDTTSSGMKLTAQLPLNRLEFGFGKALNDEPDTILNKYGNELASYLLQHVGVRSERGSWQVLRPQLQIVNIGGSAELQAAFTLHSPPGEIFRKPELLYDVITHEVRTHRVQVYLRNDWEAGFVGKAPVLLGELSHGNNTLSIPLESRRTAAGIISLFREGIAHIAEGTDHLLFLLMLLLVAPLTARTGRWSSMRTSKQTVKHTTWIITAFTVGHTTTLVLGSIGLIALPGQSVEVAVAATIAAAGLHAWRPLFAGAESLMALSFGLIHGLAFSASLSGIGLTPWQHVHALFAFNLGIEAMQLIALAAVLPPLLILGTSRPAWYAHFRTSLASLAGLLAAVWMLDRTGMIDIGEIRWLGDGGAIPITLVILLWVVALGCFAVVQSRKVSRTS